MLRRAGWIMAVVLLAAPIAAGQAPAPSATSAPPEQIPAPVQPPIPDGAPAGNTAPLTLNQPPTVPSVYAIADSLLWWVAHGPAPVLLTTAPNNGLNATGLTGGIIGKPGTTILFDGSNLSYGGISGARAMVGVNLGSDGFWALEGGGFYLPQQSINYLAVGRPNGTPLLTVPFLDAATGQQASLDISSENAAFQPFLAGSIAIHSDIQVWGAEINAVAHSIRTAERSFDLFLGLRSLTLNENLTINQIITPAQTGNITLQYPTVGMGAADYYSVVAGSPVQVFDSFATRNQFYGAQVGGRFMWNYGTLGADLTVKVAAGITHQQASIAGSSSALNAINPVTGAVASNLTTPGGVFALQNNIGNYAQNPFTIAPEIGLNLSWAVTSWMRLRFGYGVLFWSNVARPGSQIDSTLNSKLIPTGALLPTSTTPIGAFIPGEEQGRPYFTFRDTTFWAQGIHLGIDFRY